MYLFIYCEWLDSALVKRYLPSAKFETKVTLENHQVAFTSYTHDDSDDLHDGGCHLECSPGQLLHGVLYDISEEDLVKLDKLTRVELGAYEKKYIDVDGKNGKIYSTVSHSIKNPKGKSSPSKEYMDHMINGAREFNFPETYIEKLEKLRYLDIQS